MINVIISGANGYMGRVLSRLAACDPEVNIVAGIDINAEQSAGFPIYASPFDFTGKADVIIDFSHPSAFEAVTRFAESFKIPVVMATTGLSAEQRNRLKSLSSSIPVFFSANYSIGINLVIDLVKRAVSALDRGFDIEIVEKHHNRKIDAPSGTALAIADAVAEASPEPLTYMYDRHSSMRKRAQNEIGIHSIRGGTIVGEHEVIFAGNDEVIEIKHSAASRDIFAQGAIMAAKFLSKKKTGFYTMTDLLG